MTLEISEDALDQIARVGFDPVYGARPLRRAIQSEIENPLARKILDGLFTPGETIEVIWDDGEFEFIQASVELTESAA